MNKIYKSLGFVLALSLFSACYKDHSVKGDRPLALVEVSEPMASEQTAAFGKVTVIKSPEYKILCHSFLRMDRRW